MHRKKERGQHQVGVMLAPETRLVGDGEGDADRAVRILVFLCQGSQRQENRIGVLCFSLLLLLFPYRAHNGCSLKPRSADFPVIDA